MLYCEVTANWWIDTAPSSTGAIGDWNRTLLLRLGSEPRGFSSHRSGFVARTCILVIMRNKGTELPPGVMDLMVRAGGWQAVTGAKTVLRVYAQQVRDEYLDAYSMSLSVDNSNAEWARQLALYIGKPSFLKPPEVDAGRDRNNSQVRIHAWRSPIWRKHQDELNAACAALMTAAASDHRIMPVKSYKELRHAFSRCEKHPAFADSDTHYSPAVSQQETNLACKVYSISSRLVSHHS